MSESVEPRLLRAEALQRAEAIIATNEIYRMFQAREDAKPLPITMVPVPAEPGPVIELPTAFKSDAKRRAEPSDASYPVSTD